MFWKVLRYASQHDSAVWKFLRLSYRWLWIWIVLTNLFKMLTPRHWSIVSLPEYAKFFRKDSPFSQHVPSYPNRQLHPPLFGVPPLWQLPLLHDRVTTKLYGHCPPHCAENVFLSHASLRAISSTRMGARTPNTPASNPTVYRIAWCSSNSSSSSPPRESRIDLNAQEQKANCQNADFHIAFLSVVCLVISFT